MSDTSPRRAIYRYHKHLAERGLARFEVIGRKADRELIRSVAKCLAEEGPEADRLRAVVPIATGVLALALAGLNRHGRDREDPFGSLAEEGPEADRLRAVGSRANATPCDAPRWWALTSFLPVHSRPVARSICDPISSRHQHHQQHHPTGTIRVVAGVDG